MISICVYCGSREGHDPRFAEAARDFGRLLGARGLRLVYGGGRRGLMGAVADGALEAGGQVLGVIPRRLMERELGHGGVQALRIVDTMHERKLQMAEASDAFVALPGGLGTLEELFETWTWQQLGYHAHPIGLLDTAGFHAPLRALLAHLVDQGFVQRQQVDAVLVDPDPEQLLQRLLARVHADRDGADFRPA